MKLKFSAIDTETIKGKCKVICNEKEGLFVNSFKEIMDFLFKRCNRKIMSYNLDYDATSILLYLNKDLLQDLVIFGKCKYKNYEIRYIKKKELVIKKGKKKVYIYDLLQFFNISLNKASEKFLNDKKIEIDIKNIDKLIKKRNKKVIDYCIKDAQLTYRLWEKLSNELQQLKIKINRPLSVAFLSSNYFRDYFRNEKINKFINNSFRLAFYGGRFEVCKKGYFNNVIMYDINSAYPHAIDNLYSLKGCEIKYNNEPGKNTIYGLFKIKCNFDNRYVLPLPLRLRSGKVIFCYGEFETYITYEEYKLLKELNFKFEIIDNIIINNEKRKIIDMNKLYEIRKSNDKLNYVLKILMNSLYGKLCQMTEKKHLKEFLTEYDIDLLFKKDYEGRLTNFIFSSFITSFIRCNLYKTSYKNRYNVIFYATDCIMFNDNIKIDTGKGLGKYDIKYQGEAIIIGNGIYALRDRDNWNWHRRGFRNLDLSLLEMSKREIEVITTQRTGLTEASLRLKKNVNEIKEIIKKLDLNFDNKRLWKDDLDFKKLFTSSIDSEPIPVDLELQKMIT